MFFHPYPYIWQDLRGLFTSVQARKEVGRSNKNSLGVQKGRWRWRPLESTSKDYFAKAFAPYVEHNKKWFHTGVLLAKKKYKKHPRTLIHFFQNVSRILLELTTYSTAI
jgi:hypothetical protein